MKSCQGLKVSLLFRKKNNKVWKLNQSKSVSFNKNQPWNTTLNVAVETSTNCQKYTYHDIVIMFMIVSPFCLNPVTAITLQSLSVVSFQPGVQQL